MKWMWRSGVVAGGLLVAAQLAMAQLPGAPAAPAVPGAGALPGAAGAAGVPGAAAGLAEAAPKGFFAKMCVAFEACRRKICATPAGAMLNNATKPLTAITGGIIPPLCPVMPNLADLQKPGVAGTSDAIKKDALEAKMRRDKVRFLATVDCRYYPDAIGALIAALRTDGSECVRFEAALALGRGCCCNEKTIKALDYTVSGSDKDGNPSERSIRVRCAAAIALERCLSCYVPPPVEVEPKIGGGEGPGSEGGKKPGDTSAAPSKLPDAIGSKPPTTPSENRMPSKETVEAAWRTLNDFNAHLAATQPQGVVNLSGDRSSVYQIIKTSASTPLGGTSAVQPAAVNTAMATPASQSSPFSAAPLMPPTRSTLAPPTTEPMPRTPSPAAMNGKPAVAPVERSTPEPRHTPVLMPSAPVMTTPPAATPSAPPVTSAGGSQTPGAATPIAPVIAQMLQGATTTDRHAAIRQLVRFDWQKNPVVMSALLAGAKADPAPVVRVDCIRHLAAYQMAHPQVMAELGAITQDTDPWVRDEAAKALAQLKQTP